MRVSDKTLSLFLQLSQNTDFVEWVEQEKQNQMSNLVQLGDVVQIHQAQGRVKELDLIQQLMQIARKR